MKMRSEVGKKWKKASVMSYRIGHSILPNMQLCHLKTLGSQGWDDWMTSLTQWTWTGANSERQCRTEEPGVLQSMGWWRVRHDLPAEHTHKHQYDGLGDKKQWTKTLDPVNLKRNMLSEKSQTEKHVLYMLHDFLEKAKQQAQKRDQWMPRSMCGRRGWLKIGVQKMCREGDETIPHLDWLWCDYTTMHLLKLIELTLYCSVKNALGQECRQ